jgi:hypothetical protein
MKKSKENINLHKRIIYPVSWSVLKMKKTQKMSICTKKSYIHHIYIGVIMKKNTKKCQSTHKNHISTELIGVKNEKNTKKCQSAQKNH